MADGRKIRKTIFIVIGTALVLYILTVVYNVVMLGYDFGFFDKEYSTYDLGYKAGTKRTELIAVKRYFNSIVPANKVVEIEFKSDDKIAKWEIHPGKSDSGQAVKFSERNLDINSGKVNEALKMLRWTPNTLEALKQRLDAAGCIGIQSGEPARVSYQHHGSDTYYFNVFSTPIPDSLKAHYNDSCQYVYINSRLVVENGGEGMGSHCFPNGGK